MSEKSKVQNSEKTIFMPLLAELCKNVEQKVYSFGRPSIPMSDMIFCTVMKIYSMRSLRRFMGDLKIAEEKGFVDKTPCFASIGHLLQRKEITHILMNLIVKSSLPLKSVEIRTIYTKPVTFATVISSSFCAFRMA